MLRSYDKGNCSAVGNSVFRLIENHSVAKKKVSIRITFFSPVDASLGAEGVHGFAARQSDKLKFYGEASHTCRRRRCECPRGCHPGSAQEIWRWLSYPAGRFGPGRPGHVRST